LRKAAEVTIRRQELLDAVTDAEGRDPGIMNGSTSNSRLLNQRLERFEETFAFSQQDKRGRLKPVSYLKDSILDRSRGTVNPGVGHDCKKFIQTGPGYCPQRGSFSKLRHSAIGLAVPRRIRPVSVDKNVGVDGNQDLPQPVDQLANFLPIAFGHTDLKPLAFESVPFQSERSTRALVRELPLKRFLDNLPKRFLFPSSAPFCLLEEFVGNHDGGFHMANHIVGTVSLSTALRV
jgi:hypothetical protein